MSHRVTTRIDIADLEVLKEAFEKQTTEVRGSTFLIRSGECAGVDVNFRTGEVGYDNDHVAKVGILRLKYNEAKYLRECRLQGISVVSREVTSEGDIVLTLRTA